MKAAMTLSIPPALAPHIAERVRASFDLQNAMVLIRASLPALDWHATQNQAELLAHNRQLTGKLIDAADDLNLTLLTPRPLEKRGGSIMLRLPDSHPAAQIVTNLRAQGITTDARSQTLRLSPGNLTTMAGTETLITALTQLLRP